MEAVLSPASLGQTDIQTRVEQREADVPVEDGQASVEGARPIPLSQDLVRLPAGEEQPPEEEAGGRVSGFVSRARRRTASDSGRFGKT
jgi:hypothetical protein